MKEDKQNWLVVFADVKGLEWVLSNQRMAFPRGACRKASRIRPGDSLFFYVTRPVWKTPQLLGVAQVVSGVQHLTSPVRINWREFPCACDLVIKVIRPDREGVPFTELVPKLRFIARKEEWGSYLRGSLIALPSDDASLLKRSLSGRSKQDRTADISR